MLISLSPILLCLSLTSVVSSQQNNDTLGIAKGFTSFETGNFLVELVNSSQTLASLIPASNRDFNFLPNKTFLAQRASDGQYQLGDVILRYRSPDSSEWTTQDSAVSRAQVINITPSAPETIMSGDLSPTFNISCKSSIEVIRIWGTAGGDLTLSFTLRNTRKVPLEVGGLGFPMISDSIFTKRTAVDINENCSLIDPNIGLDGGYLRFSRVNGQGPAMVVTPLNQDSGLEGWGFLHEKSPGSDPLGYQTESFEGYYQYMPFTLAYVEKEWNSSQPWNAPRSKVLLPGATLNVGFRFTLADNIESIEEAVSSLGVPVVKGLPGYILPQDLDGQLVLLSESKVSSMSTDPLDALRISQSSDDQWLLSAQPGHWGRVKLLIEYEDGRRQSVHYYLTKSAPEAIYDAGRFLNDRHWWDDSADPFGRAPSFMCVDHSDGTGSLVLQDYLARVWLSGECHEAGASWYTMALKQIAQPEAEQVSKLERFIDEVLWKTIQLPSYAVRQSIFYYDPNMTDFTYDPQDPWRLDTSKNYSVSWSKARADVTSRSYGYTYPATTYWALYRIGRSNPSMLQRQSWEWYLSQAYQTVVYCFQEVNGTHLQPLWLDGLMGETAYGELLKDLYREGWFSEASTMEDLMRARVDVWSTTEVPFGSELGWDCTGEEGVYYWANYFGNYAVVNKTIQTIMGYMPSVAHWAYHGNARRYWDFQFDGKISRIERQVHHYGSSLNALPLLGFARAYPETASQYLTRLAYGGLFAPLSNIHADGFGSAAFHSWAETLAWDNYSGDYGLAFAGLILGSMTFIRDNASDGGLQVFGGSWEYTDANLSSFSVWPKDALRRRLYIATMRLSIELDAGAISQAIVEPGSSLITLKISRSPMANAVPADECVMWLNQDFYVNSSDSGFEVTGSGISRKRAGWAIPLVGNTTLVQISLLE